MRRIFCHILPAEWIVLSGFLAASLFIFSGYPLMIPRAQGGEVLSLLGGTRSYGVILLFSIGLFIAITLVRSIVRREFAFMSLCTDICIFLRLLVGLLIAVYMMLCFKWWSHLHGPLYDEYYFTIDHSMAWLKDPLLRFAEWLALPHVYYFWVFTWIFIAGYALCIALSTPLFVRMVTANIAVAVLGGIGYTLAPAYGPLFFSMSSDPVIGQTQAVMLETTQAFRASGGGVLDPVRFEAVLGAMPSLHVAHALVICIYLWRLHIVTGLCFAIAGLYIAMYAIVTKFHYIIDLPFGVLLAIGAVLLSDRLYRNIDRQKVPRKGF